MQVIGRYPRGLTAMCFEVLRQEVSSEKTCMDCGGYETADRLCCSMLTMLSGQSAYAFGLAPGKRCGSC
jgi:hypothetical protein